MTAVMDPVDTRTWSTTQVGAWLGLSNATMHRWSHQLGAVQPGPGAYGRIRLTRADVLTMYAWVELGATRGGDYRPSFITVRKAVTEAIRTRPAPCLVILGPGRACTVDTWEAAVRLAFDLGRGHMRWCVDLTPAWEWTAPTDPALQEASA